MFDTSKTNQKRTIGDPCDKYERAFPLWRRNRLITGCEIHVKNNDELGRNSPMTSSNFLIPFSPLMDPDQYSLLIKEAELPGVTAQYEGMIRGGLLRKAPLLTLSEKIQEGALQWLTSEIGRDGGTLLGFLDELLFEELRTNHTWIQIDYPKVGNPDEPPANARPYPIIWPAESVINWLVSEDENGLAVLKFIIIRVFESILKPNEYHPTQLEVIYFHTLDEEGNYEVQRFEKTGETYEKVGPPVQVLVNGERIKFIPIWPASGMIDPGIPFLTTLVDKEVSLYNKMARRNHLLYGAATYTPWIRSDMSEPAFNDFVNSGLGTWLRLQKEEEVGVLKTPTDALSDLDKSIESALEEIAKLGVRMLTNETNQSGVALQLRNAVQTAQLGSINKRISSTMKQLISFMLQWRYDLELEESDIVFELSSDFDKTTLDSNWMRLITEWYESGLIPRSIWLDIAKRNELIGTDYDDEKGVQDIEKHRDLITPKAPKDFLNRGFE